jgi:hypothetical protein
MRRVIHVEGGFDIARQSKLARCPVHSYMIVGPTIPFVASTGSGMMVYAISSSISKRKGPPPAEVLLVALGKHRSGPKKF